MKYFKLVQRIVAYESCWVQAETKEEALAMYQADDVQLNGWEHDDYDYGASELIAVDEGPGEDDIGELITHDVENGKFVDPDVCDDCHILIELCRCNDEKRLGRIP